MDEFARVMSMEGVRPLDESKQKPSHTAAQPRTIPSSSVVAPPTMEPTGYAWVTGPRACTAPETALERLANEIRIGGVIGQPASVRMAEQSRCLHLQERHRCWAPQIANRCAS